jgi:hypothetical protein
VTKLSLIAALKSPAGVSLGLGIILTTITFWSFLPDYATHLPSEADGILISYLLNWPRLALELGRNIYQIPIFHPFTNTLGYTEPYLTSSLTTWLLLPFTQNVLLIQNLMIFWSTIAMCASMFVLVHYLTKSWSAAVLSAIVYAFSPLQLHYWVHLHSYYLIGLPLTLFWTWKWFDTWRLRYLVLAAVTFLYQALNDPMTGFFILAAVVPALAYNSVRVRPKTRLLPLVITWVVTLGMTFLFYLPFFQVSAEFNYTRSIRDTAHFAHSFDIFLTPALVLLYLITVWLLIVPPPQISNYSRSRRWWVWLVVTVLGGILMLGPVLKLDGSTVRLFSFPIPLPYALAYYAVPGFQAFRDSSRWISVFHFGFVLLFAEVISQKRLTRAMTTVLASGVFMTFLALQVPKMEMLPITSGTPQIYSYLAQVPGKVVAEFPVFSWTMQPYSKYESYRLLHQTQHHKILYNGTSGFTPPVRERDWDWLWKHFPDPNTLEYLRQEGVDIVIVHYSLYEQLTQEKFTYQNHEAPQPLILKKQLAESSALETVICIPEACIYTIKE